MNAQIPAPGTVPQPQPHKQGFPNWAKIAIGLGCGCPVALFGGLFALGVLGSMFGVTPTESGGGRPKSMEELPPRVLAYDLVKQYAENEVAADERYKGKKLWVGGTVERVGKDIMDDSYVALKGMDIRSVQCFFEDEKQLATLKVGSRIVIEGECDGLMMNVLLKDCSIVTPDRLPPEKK